MNRPTDGFATAEIAGLRFSYPADWQAVPHRDADLVLAWPEESGLGFRPNLVALSESTEMSIQRLSTRAMATAIAAVPGSYLIACDLWGSAPVEGRSIEFTYPSVGSTVYVNKYLFRFGGQAVDLTFSCAVGQHSSLQPLISYIASSAQPVEAAA